MTIDLSFAQNAYNEAEAAPEGGGSRIPDGTYQVWCQKAEITEEGFEGKRLEFPLLKLTFRELATTNRPLFLNQQIHTDPKRMGFLKRLVMQLWPFNAPSLMELEARLPELFEKAYEVTAKTTVKGDKSYQNVYLNRILEGVELPQVDDLGNRLPF